MTKAPKLKGWPVSGTYRYFLADSLRLFQTAARKHGDVVRLRLGHVTAHLINHPDHINHVLSRHADRYDKNTRSVARIAATCGDSLLSADPDAWARHRKLIQPVFQPSYLNSRSQAIDDSITPLLDRWGHLADAGEPIDIVAEMMAFVCRTAAAILFGTQVDSDKIEAALAVILNDTWRRINLPFDLSQLTPRLHRPSFKRALATLENIVARIIQERRANDSDHDDVLTRLLHAHEAEGDAKLSDKELRDAVLTLLLAGHETTANALAWAFWHVGQTPDLAMADPADIFAETVRLYPSIWIIERRAVIDDTIGGYAIPKNSVVLISPYVLHRHPDFWPDADTFDPSRFNDATAATRPRHAYLPFGLGMHRCVGLHMAQLIATRALAQVHAQFRLVPAPVQSPAVDAGITLRHKGPLMMRPERRR